MLTNAGAIAEVLRDAGVRRCFGHPGGEIVVFIDACRQAGIEFVLVGHEGSGAFMADATGWLTGIPGVCVSTLGPGATNLVTGVANAYLDRSPIVTVTAHVSTGLDPSYTHQRLDLNALFTPVTKWSATIDGHGTSAIAQRAVDLAREPRRGPVHLALPSDLAAQEVSSPHPRVPLPAADGPRPIEGQAITHASTLISSARRPIVVVGLGTCSNQTGSALRRFVETTRMPFLTTAKAKGTIDELHPLFVGTASGMAGDQAILHVLDECDVLVGVGFDPVECDKDWFAGRRFVCVDEISHAEGGYQPEVQVIGDIDALLYQLAERIACQHVWTNNEVRLRRDTVAMTVAPRSSPRMGLSPYAVLQRLQEALPEDAILTCDVGSHKLLVGQVWRSRCSGTFLMSNGLSAMGYGLSAAIAAGLEYPDRPVLCVTGDGGFLMGLHNLELMVRRRIPVVVAVYTDQTLAAIRIAQTRRRLPSYGVDFGRPDYTAIAQAFGAVGRRVEQLEEVIPACRDALKSGIPSVLDISIDPQEYWDQM